jgi:hypothetical protein
MTTLTHLQACTLFGQIRKGKELGVDADGNVVYGETPFSISLEALGFNSVYLYRSNASTQERPYMTDRAVKFLREWADALEVPKPDGGSV